MEDTVTGYTFRGYIFTWRTVWEGMLDKRIWQSRIKEKHNVVDIRTNSLGEKCQEPQVGGTACSIACCEGRFTQRKPLSSEVN